MTNEQNRQTNEDTIRSYGPGKFSTILDSYVYEVSLQGGPDDEIGSVTENGSWFGLMRHGQTICQDHDPFLESLNDAERIRLTESAGVIIEEDAYGFVGVSYFETEDALDVAWDAIVSAFQATYGEDESNDSADFQ